MPEINFDSTQIEPIGSFELLPVGEYLVIISGSEYKKTKPKDGRAISEYLSLTFTVVDGESKGRKLFASLHIDNPNPDAKEIAKRTLSAICGCIDTPRPKMTEEMHNKPLIVKVAIRAANGQFDAQNEIKAYKRADGKPLTAPVANSVPATTTGKRPWEKNK
jgi:hypothetical protein